MTVHLSDDAGNELDMISNNTVKVAKLLTSWKYTRLDLHSSSFVLIDRCHHAHGRNRTNCETAKDVESLALQSPFTGHALSAKYTLGEAGITDGTKLRVIDQQARFVRSLVSFRFIS